MYSIVMQYVNYIAIKHHTSHKTKPTKTCRNALESNRVINLPAE